MINTTARPILLASGKKLDSLLRESLSWAAMLLEEQLAERNMRLDLKQAFSAFLGESNRRIGKFDETFVSAVFDFAGDDRVVNIAAQQSMATMSCYVKRRTAPGTHFPIVKRGLKLTLIQLWRSGGLILPTLFTPGSQSFLPEFDHELLDWLQCFDPNSSGEAQKKTTWRLHYYGPRMVMTTDWLTVEDVSLNELADLHRARVLCANGLHEHRVVGSMFPWTHLPAALLKQFPDRVKFAEADLAKYSAWQTTRGIVRGALEAFGSENWPASAPSMKKRKPKRKAREEWGEEAKTASTHDAILSFLRRPLLRPATANWREQTPVYPGREHIDVTPISANWIPSFEAFLHYRQHVQGYRSDSAAVYSLNILADYLFLYLPWWREIFPHGLAGVPWAPKDFTRYAFVSRHTEEPIESLPTTLLNFIRLRRKKAEPAASCMRFLALYFRFVGAQFADDPKIAGPAFRNPLDLEFDTPRLSGKKSKTNKEVIPEPIYGHLLFYCLALEQFGQHLLQRCIRGELQNQWQDLRGALRYDTASLGLTPIVTYRGREIPLRTAPNVFTWAERKVVRGGSEQSLVVPHLTALRLLLVSLETGLRCQSVQWLDRTTWDSLNKGRGDEYIYSLLVNTDKTKVEAWAPAIVFRVREVMQREVEFQKLFADFDKFPPVHYEGLETAPFEPVRPLFKSPNSGEPIRDNTYSKAWISLLIDFEAFYREDTGEHHVQLYYLRPLKAPDGEPVIRHRGVEENSYCPISTLATHTPHSCRATFATNRQAKGLLEASDVAELLGHSGVVTTSRYTKFSGEQIKERLRRSDAALLGDYSIFSTGPDSPYIRPDKPGSALMQSFSKDRVAAVDEFRFMPSIALWSIEDRKLDEQDGLSLLKSGPMSRIRFRETHICPVGEECPADIVRQIGTTKRCGMCPLAMKCIDHLPAITAKKNFLVERIRYLQAQRKRMEAAGEPAASLDQIWDEVQLDINELLGWKLSEEVLQRAHAEADCNDDGLVAIHVERPDIVRRHLQRVTRACDTSEFLLQRLAESNAFPSMASPQVQAAASLLRRRLSAGQHLEDLESPSEDNDDVQVAASMLRMLMQANGLSISEMASLLRLPERPIAALPPLLQPGGCDGK